jgi:hypothetical protein
MRQHVIFVKTLKIKNSRHIASTEHKKEFRQIIFDRAKNRNENDSLDELK